MAGRRMSLDYKAFLYAVRLFELPNSLRCAARADGGLPGRSAGARGEAKALLDGDGEPLVVFAPLAGGALELEDRLAVRRSGLVARVDADRALEHGVAEAATEKGLDLER